MGAFASLLSVLQAFLTECVSSEEILQNSFYFKCLGCGCHQNWKELCC